MDESDLPIYRLRLFLSVDLVGSTAFKSDTGRSNLKWIKAFQKFYGEFPAHFSKKYEQICAEIADMGEDEKLNTPKVWKTIGDEIIFVNRVNSITQLGAYVQAFSEALIDFGDDVRGSYNLDTKGNAWIAAFPTPNRSIQLAINGLADPLSGEQELLGEKFEAAVDKKPSDYDFLGKGIDGGFRISRNSTTETFTISPALAYLLCKAKRNIDTTKFNGRFIFHEPQNFKGVVGGARYPVISLITSRSPEFDDLETLEAELLDRPREANFVVLGKYLENYMSYYGIEVPVLKLTDKSVNISSPDHYESYIKEWKRELDEIRHVREVEEVSAEQNGSSSPQPIGLYTDQVRGIVEALSAFTKSYERRNKNNAGDLASLFSTNLADRDAPK